MVISVLTNNDPNFLDHLKFTCSDVHISKVNDVHEKLFPVQTQPQVRSIDRKILRSNRYFFCENEYALCASFWK